MAKITYQDKEDARPGSLPVKHKVTAADMNMIKASVNALYENEVKRCVMEINAANFTQLKNGNNSYGIMALPEVNGKIIEIVNTPIVYNNGIKADATYDPLVLNSGSINVSGPLQLYQGYAGMAYEMNFDEGNNFIIKNNQAPAANFRISPSVVIQRMYPGGSGVDPLGPYPGAIFIYLNFSGSNPQITPAFKAWVCFDYITRSTPV